MTMFSTTLLAATVGAFAALLGCATSGIEPREAIISPSERQRYQEALYAENWAAARAVLKANEKPVKVGSDVVSGVVIRGEDVVVAEGGTRVLVSGLSGRWRSVGDISKVFDTFPARFEKCQIGSKKRAGKQAERHWKECLSETIVSGRDEAPDNRALCLEEGKVGESYCKISTDANGLVTIDPPTPEALLGRLPHIAPRSALKQLSEIPYAIVAEHNRRRSEELAEKTKASEDSARRSAAIKKARDAGCFSISEYQVVQKIGPNQYEVATADTYSGGKCFGQSMGNFCSDVIASEGERAIVETTTAKFTSEGDLPDDFYVRDAGKRKVTLKNGFERDFTIFREAEDCRAFFAH
jgi:hypothetical protein